MTYPQLHKLIRKALREAENEAIDKGLDTTTPEFKEKLLLVRNAILSKLKVSESEYDGYIQDLKDKAKVKSANKKEALLEEMRALVPRVTFESLEDKPHIPTAEEVAKLVVIPPPQIINQIVKEITIEKPTIVKETVVEQILNKEEYNDNPLRAELGYLNDKVDKIKIPEVDLGKLEEKLDEKYKQTLKDGINTLGMPDFRKLGMGLRGDMDALSSRVDNITTPDVAALWGGITGTLSNQTDLQSALDLKVPTSRTLTINGTALDLSANRSWTVSATPGGSDTQIQFNDSGAFGGDDDFTYNKTTNALFIQHSGTGFPSFTAQSNNTSNVLNSAYFTFARNNSATTTLATTIDTQRLGGFLFQGVTTGNALANSGFFGFEQSGTAGASRVPTKFIVQTSDGTNLTDRLTISSAGITTVGGQLLVNGFTSSTIGQIIRLASSQSVDGWQLQTSVSGVLAKFDNTGYMTSPGWLSYSAGASTQSQIDVDDGTTNVASLAFTVGGNSRYFIRQYPNSFSTASLQGAFVIRHIRDKSNGLLNIDTLILDNAGDATFAGGLAVGGQFSIASQNTPQVFLDNNDGASNYGTYSLGNNANSRWQMRKFSDDWTDTNLQNAWALRLVRQKDETLLNLDTIIVDNVGNVGIQTGTNAISALLHLIDTTEQLRIGYDTSNYYKTTVGSTGGVTFDAVGSGALFTFSDNVVVPDLKATTYHVGADAGIDATVTYVDTVLGAQTLTFKKGILTSQA